jgi:hypothetical protein
LIITDIISIFTLAICSKACENGGKCVAPNTCSCPPYFTGPQCTTGKSNMQLYILLLINFSDAWMALWIILGITMGQSDHSIVFSLFWKSHASHANYSYSLHLLIWYLTLSFIYIKFLVSVWLTANCEIVISTQWLTKYGFFTFILAKWRQRVNMKKLWTRLRHITMTTRIILTRWRHWYDDERRLRKD